MFEQLVEPMVQYGAIGIMLAISVYWIFRTHKDHKLERAEWKMESSTHVERFAGLVEKNNEAFSRLEGAINNMAGPLVKTKRRK